MCGGCDAIVGTNGYQFCNRLVPWVVHRPIKKTMMTDNTEDYFLLLLMLSIVFTAIMYFYQPLYVP
jgi:hypothetical protein